MLTDVISELPGVVPPPLPVTVTVAVDEMIPVKPFIAAVIVLCPAETAVTVPDELTVATAGELEVHVARSVTSELDEG